MILQTKGKQTAQALAGALEVSERTIYRDVIALSSAGVPIYTDKGPGGGIQLIEEYRTSLTGLSPEEVRALFMINIPAALVSLGMDQEVKTAWLKLTAALPDYLQQYQKDARKRMLIDQSWWQDRPEHAPAFLRELYRAVWEDRVIHITVRYQFGYQADHQVEPYSLVSQRQRWFLVGCIEGNLKVFWLSDIQELKLTNQTFSRSAEFDLHSFWHRWISRQEAMGFGYRARLSATPEALRILKHLTSAIIETIEAGTDPNWQLLSLRFDSFNQARRSILDLGGAVKVLEPLPLARTIEDYAQQIIKLYPD
ncbi:MAG: WYL domain-containing protein [Anaerolineales bacterium]|nr:WYL domain-containing protein [Anaerolineales bacterium]